MRDEDVCVCRDLVGDLPRLLAVPRDLEGAPALSLGRLPGRAVDLAALQRHRRVLEVDAVCQQGFCLECTSWIYSVERISLPFKRFRDSRIGPLLAVCASRNIANLFQLRMLDDVPVRRPRGAGLRVEAQVVIARDDHLQTVWNIIRIMTKN